jgi:PAS domain-containing protein
MIQSLKERRIGHTSKAEQVQHTLGRLRSLSDGIDESIYIIDPETYEILFANAKTQELFGKEIAGKKCFRVFQNRSKPCPIVPTSMFSARILGKLTLGIIKIEEINNGTEEYTRLSNGPGINMSNTE